MTEASEGIGRRGPLGEGSDPARDRWRQTVRAKAIAGSPERRHRFET
jgi:hypothetical protein